jgi:hypothetical protein|tara:strand:+ start:509 stop:712 length:204 start_codon:yes stop_codon:yes gene_type:complete
MRTVKFNGAPIKEPPKPTTKAEIKGQGSIPYAQAKEEKTPNTEKAKITKGKARGMGAAERGGSFTIA